MAKKYFFPLNFQQLMSGQKLEKEDVANSIYQHIHLILMSRLGENRFDRAYGCKLWDSDFDIRTTDNNWGNEIERTLETIIQQYEPRIYQDFKVKVRIVDDETLLADRITKKVRRKFVVSVQSIRLKATNENLAPYEYTIIFSPISLD